MILAHAFAGVVELDGVQYDTSTQAGERAFKKALKKRTGKTLAKYVMNDQDECRTHIAHCEHGYLIYSRTATSEVWGLEQDEDAAQDTAVRLANRALSWALTEIAPPPTPLLADMLGLIAWEQGDKFQTAWMPEPSPSSPSAVHKAREEIRQLISREMSLQFVRYGHRVEIIGRSGDVHIMTLRTPWDSGVWYYAFHELSPAVISDAIRDGLLACSFDGRRHDPAAEYLPWSVS